MGTKTAKKPEKGQGNGRGDNGPGKSKIPPTSAEQDALRRATKARRKPAPAKARAETAPPAPKQAEAEPTSKPTYDRVQAVGLHKQFETWFELSSAEVDIWLSSVEEDEKVENYLACFFLPGIFPSGLKKRTIEDMRNVFVDFCLKCNVPSGTLLGQKTGWYFDRALTARINARVEKLHGARKQKRTAA